MCKISGFFYEIELLSITFNTANSIDISFYFDMGHNITIYFIFYNTGRQRGVGVNLNLDGGNEIFTSRLSYGLPDFWILVYSFMKRDFLLRLL